MIKFTISYPFIVITLHCLQKVALERKIIRINVYIVETTKLEKDDRSNTSRSEWSTPHVN